MLLILKLTKFQNKNCYMNDLVVIKNQRTAQRIKNGNPWIYANELLELPNLQSGSIVKIVDKDKNSYGLGFYNRNSLITVRLLFADEISYNLVKTRIISSIAIRDKIIENSNYCRVVFGESDYLPGLIIDRYGDYYSIEIFSAGCERIKESITKAILEINPKTKGIIQKNSSVWRLREGLGQDDEILFGEIPKLVEIEENRVRYQVDLSKGQKTGYFYDQRLNRLFLQQISKKSKVLDLFCNQGGFSLNAAKAGATKVIGVDIQSNVIESAKNNAAINNFESIEFIEIDCVDFLKTNTEKFDIVISDPPAFTKSKKNIPDAIGAYFGINKRAIKNLIPGGILLTSSCSHHIYEDKFYEIIQKAAQSNRRKLRLIYRGLQSPDHPILDALPETKYLKFFGFIVD